MPDVRCSCCHKQFWWVDDSREYCNNCLNKR